ncbi:MAG: OmpA family protein [Pseudoxanthomonas sp.]
MTQLAGRSRVETGAHFETGDATLSEQDKPLLDDFAKVIRGSPSDAVVTVEGFADPAGSSAFNRRIGQRRAEAILDYLTANGGLAADQVRAVSYGDDQNRQVRPGATGADAGDNRRVALLIDHAVSGTSTSM